MAAMLVPLTAAGVVDESGAGPVPVPNERSFSGEGALPDCGGEETTQVGAACKCYVYSNGLAPEYWQEANQYRGLQRAEGDHKMTLPDWTVNCVMAQFNAWGETGVANVDGAGPVPAAGSLSGGELLPACGGEETIQIGVQCMCYVYSNGLTPEYWQERNQRQGLQRAEGDHKMTLPDWSVNCVVAQLETCCVGEAGVVEESRAGSIPGGRSFSSEEELPACGGEETVQVGLSCMCYVYSSGLTVQYWQERNQERGLQRAEGDHRMTLPDWSVNCVAAQLPYTCCVSGAGVVDESKPVPAVGLFSGRGDDSSGRLL